MTSWDPSSKPEPERFLSELAHDLRNLLEGVQIAFSGDWGTGSKELYHMTYREIYDLIRKTENHVDRTRLKHGRIELRPESVELDSVCRESVSKLSPFLQKRRLTFETADETSFATADAASVSKIVVSLLHTAARLTADGDGIQMSLGRTGGKAQVKVDIPPKSISDGRVDRLLSMSDESSLGLGVSRALARFQGGDVWSERHQGGDPALRFVLSLPEAPEPRRAEPAAAKNADLSILVVDDNTDAARSLAALLSLSGYEAEVRHDGRSAIEAVQSLSPQVVLLDLGLPDIDGYEVCRKLRRADAPKDLALVAISGRGDDEARRLSEEAGFDAHLLKPVDRGELLRVLSRY
jgi:CheY-like chemotaxis protein